MQPPTHAVLCLRAQNTMVWQEHVAEKIDALPELADRDLAGVQRKKKFSAQENTDGMNESLQLLLVRCDDGKVIRIAYIVTNPEFMFYILIQFIQVNICKELRCQIANGQPPPQRS